ncbi:MAG: hypothetical protein AAF518_08660, partial [Spirochaetota bacterium]
YSCYKDTISIGQKSIKALQTGFYVFSFPVEISNGWQDECESLLKSERLPFSWRQIFPLRKRNGGVASLKLQLDNKSQQMLLKGEKW